jgi:3-methyl-2-oxobutanoate hydroxymethyltransferase
MDTTLSNAIRLFQETNAQALKIEGADEVIDVIQLLSRTGIPVVAHLGLLPQSASVSGGYKVQGKTAQAAQKLIEDAKNCEAAGAIMVVLECIPYQLAKTITDALTIPVIGIGAGAETDGQVLVFHDTVTYGSHHMPKFVKAFAEAGKEITNGLTQYVDEVKSGQFPAVAHRFTMKDEEFQQLYGGKE